MKLFRIFLIVLAMSVLMMTVVSAAPAPNQLYSEYDLHRDGVIDEYDLAIVQTFSFAWFSVYAGEGGAIGMFDPYIYELADFNDDDMIDIEDIMEVAIRYECHAWDSCYWN